MTRPSKDKTFLKIAKILSKRSTCKKKRVGCVIVDKNFRILSTGYNGSPKNMPHCIDAPCEAWTDASASCMAIHAETNALLFCSDISKVHTVYITEPPCHKCYMLIKQTGAQRIVTPRGEDPT